MPVFEINSWIGGNSSFSDRGPRGSAKLFKNLDIRKTEDTLTAGQRLIDEGLYGISHSSSASLSPSASASPSGSASATQSPSATPSQSNSPSASKSASKSASPSASASPSGSTSASPSPSEGLTNVFEDLIRFFVKATDGNTYGFGNTGFIYRRYNDGYWRNVYEEPDGEIRGAVEKPSSSGATYLQWATATKIMRKPLPGNSDWSDTEIIYENLTGSDWHTMKMVEGANHIANGSLLALVGYDDSITNEALDLIPGNVAKTLIERNGRTVIGTYKSGYPNKGVNGAIDCEFPLLQVGDNGDLYFSDFTSTMPIKRFPGGGRVNPGGVCNEVDQIEIFDWQVDALSWVDKQSLGNMSIWGVFGADEGYNGLYYYGRRNKEQPFTMTLEYGLEVDEIGAVANVEGTTICSYRDGDAFGVKAVDPDFKTQGQYESLEFRAPITGVEKITDWTMAEIFMEQLPAGCGIELFFRRNKEEGWNRAYTADGEASYDKENGKKATFSIGAEMDIAEFKILLNTSFNLTPTVLRFRAYFNQNG